MSIFTGFIRQTGRRGEGQSEGNTNQQKTQGKLTRGVQERPPLPLAVSQLLRILLAAAGKSVLNAAVTVDFIPDHRELMWK